MERRIRDRRIAMRFLIGFFVVLALAGCAAATSPVTAPSAATIDVDVDGAAKRLAEAVRIPTVSSEPDAARRDATFGEFHALLARHYPAVTGALQRAIVNGSSLLYTWPGRHPAAKPILLMAHLDVVPVEAGTEGGWRHDAYAGVIDDAGVIWGRGTLDDKLGVLGIMEAATYLLANGFQPRRTIYFAFGHDEETGGEAGAAAISARLAARGVDLDFVLDEGSIIAVGLVPGVDRPVALIGTAEKGYLSLRLTATGTGGHSSMPPAENAIGRLARAIRRLERNPMAAEIRPPVSEMFDAIAPELPFVQRAAIGMPWLFEPVLISDLYGAPATNASLRPTAAPTMITGGVKDNVLPQEASVVFNFRILPGDTIDDVFAHVRAAIDDPAISIEALPGANNPSAVSDSSSESFQTLRRTVQQVFPNVVVAPALVVAATDSRHFAPIADNVYRFLPVALDADQLGGMHGTNERLDSAAYGDVIRFYIRLLENAAG
jgi:carboxypeptidase PM20D1